MSNSARPVRASRSTGKEATHTAGCRVRLGGAGGHGDPACAVVAIRASPEGELRETKAGFRPKVAMTVSGEILRGAMRSICSWKERLALAPRRGRRHPVDRNSLEQSSCLGITHGAPASYAHTELRTLRYWKVTVPLHVTSSRAPLVRNVSVPLPPVSPLNCPVPVCTVQMPLPRPG